MATLQIIGENERYPIELNQIGIGRNLDNEIVIGDEAVSANHATITIVPSSTNRKNSKDYVIEDLKSTNKTLVNGEIITSQKLNDGDIIRVGETRIKFSLKKYVAPEQELTKTKKLNKVTLAQFIKKKANKT